MNCSLNASIAGPCSDLGCLQVAYPNIEILPSPVGDLTKCLGPAERPGIKNAVEQRQREYATGRWLARKGFARLGIEGFELLAGAYREPLWPAGIVGSITHSRQNALVAVARRSDYCSVGVDMEQKGRIEPELVAKLLTARERQVYREMDPTLLFSAKESIHKLMFPMFRRYLDFLAVEIELDMKGRRFWPRFERHPDISAGLSGLHGRFLAHQGHWLTFAALTKD